MIWKISMHVHHATINSIELNLGMVFGSFLNLRKRHIQMSPIWAMENKKPLHCQPFFACTQLFNTQLYSNEISTNRKIDEARANIAPLCTTKRRNIAFHSFCIVGNCPHQNECLFGYVRKSIYAASMEFSSVIAFER